MAPLPRHHIIHLTRRLFLWSACALAAVLLAAPASAQDGKTLTLTGLVPGGARASLTDTWGKLDFSVTNHTDTDRRARVLAFFKDQPDVQYGRDVWVPARSVLEAWLPFGPAPTADAKGSRTIRFVLQDLTAGDDPLLPPTDERLRERDVLYRRREPFTAVVGEPRIDEGTPFGQLPPPELLTDEAFTLAEVFRASRSLSDFVPLIDPAALPAWPTAYQGVDHLLLATDRVADNPAGLQGLRHWVQHGGEVWVMLDRIGPATVAALLGEAADFTVVGRVGLNEFRIDTGTDKGPVQRHERPVDLVRVQLPPGETAPHTVDGWPAWFTRRVGRGTVLFTTLGPRGWHRPRTPRDPRSPFAGILNLPIASEPLVAATQALRQPTKAAAYPVEALRQALAEEVGYAVVSRGTVVTVFAAYLVGTLGLGLMLRRWGRPELLGWLGPAAALGAAAVFVALGVHARSAAPPTVAMIQVVHADAGTAEAAVEGLVARYSPDSGPAAMAARDGGFFDLDMAGIEGQTRRLILTDAGTWHWENLSLPAGVRFAPFRYTARTAEPIAAVARFGPAGIEGQLRAKAFPTLADPLLTALPGRNLAPRLTADGAFTAGAGDALPPGQFLAGTLLSDRQQRRQEIYHQFLKRSEADIDDEAPALLAWGDALETPLTLEPGARVVGSALVVVPLRFERPEPGTRVTIPGPFVPHRRVLEGKRARTPRESSQAADLHLRFQLPASVLPLKIERARFRAKVEARARRVTVSGHADGAPVELRRVEGPLGPIEVEIADERLLRPDADGGLHLHLALGDLPASAKAAGGADQTWRIEYVELEVSGRTGE